LCNDQTKRSSNQQQAMTMRQQELRHDRYQPANGGRFP